MKKNKKPVKYHKCELCPKKSRPRKCKLRSVGSGTLSNPREEVWLCKKHEDKTW